MSPIIRVAALAIAGTLALAACDGEGEVAVTPASDLTPSAEASAVAELSSRLDQLEAQLRDDVETQLADDVEARLGAVEARLGDVDPSNLRSRMSEMEEEIRLLSVALEEFQAPTDLGGGSPEATD